MCFVSAVSAVPLRSIQPSKQRSLLKETLGIRSLQKRSSKVFTITPSIEAKGSEAPTTTVSFILEHIFQDQDY